MAVVSPDTNPERLRELWNNDGWFVISGLLNTSQIAQARHDLQHEYYPDMRSVWREPDPELRREQFVGITEFPFWKSPAMCRTTFHEAIYDVAELLLGSSPTLYMAHAWAKYTEAADYDQLLHRDFRNHTLVVPDQSRPQYRQMEAMLYLSDVDPDLGPTHLVPRRHTTELPINPEFMARAGNEWLYDLEESAYAPAGSLLVYSPDVFHRGTALTRPGGSRFVISVGYQPRGLSWAGYHCWPKAGSWPPLIDLIQQASPKQLRALGFPLPEDPYWTAQIRAQVAERYPGLDLAAYLAPAGVVAAGR
ncbi:phytanoyl-CoA dioxygenase family protein [Actinoplanes sp. NPDC026619]|uniref:phytanoyl-CoA dioxygenase family protein n=1 Tax=Actinoplanes sp. NPDC026619 TaxID=3155798 RepID=UPI0033E07359